MKASAGLKRPRSGGFGAFCGGGHGPNGRWPGQTRLDVGLLEFVAMVGLGLLMVVRDWTRDGERVLMIALIYAVIRFGLDFLRVADALRAGLTPAQWGMLGIVVIALVLWRRMPPTLSAPADSR